MEPKGALSDIELLDQWQGGDSGAFDQLYDRYRAQVLRKCRRMVRLGDVAEDLCQDVFVRIYEKAPGFRRESSFSSWVYAITYHACIEYLRANKRLRFEDWERGLQIPDDLPDTEVAEMMQLQGARLGVVMEILKPEDKAILQLKYWEGMQLDEIGFILGIQGESAIKMRLNRAKKRLAALFQKMFPEK